MSRYSDARFDCEMDRLIEARWSNHPDDWDWYHKRKSRPTRAVPIFLHVLTTALTYDADSRTFYSEQSSIFGGLNDPDYFVPQVIMLANPTTGQSRRFEKRGYDSDQCLWYVHRPYNARVDLLICLFND